MNTKSKQLLCVFLLNLILLVISGCGSSGDTVLFPAPESGPETVSAAASGTPRGFEVQWSFVQDVNHFAVMENHQSPTDFTVMPFADYVTDLKHTVDIPLLTTDWANKLLAVSACNSNDTIQHMSSAITISSADVNAAIGYFKASNTAANDLFATKIALSADGYTLAVSAQWEDSNATGINGDESNNSLQSTGAVYIFQKTGATWTQQAYVKASNTNQYDNFGGSLALSPDGNTLAVGASGEDSNATGIDGDQNNNSAGSAGAVYVFVRSGTSWAQQAYIKASNTEAGDGFGFNVGLSTNGNTLAVSAVGEKSNATGVNSDQNDNSLTNAGAVYVFTRSGSTWSQQAYIKASNTDDFDLFGFRLALSGDGDTLAVNAEQEDSTATGINGDHTDNTGNNTGAVFVFLRTGTTWAQQAYIKSASSTAGDRFGNELSLSTDGNTLAVSCYRDDSNATGINGDPTDNSSGNSGSVYVFLRTGTTWAQQAYIKAANPGDDDRFGVSCAISGDGNWLVVGAETEDSNATAIGGDQTNNTLSGAGAAYLFLRSGTSWSQHKYFKASNPEGNDEFGETIAISADGNTVAVGAHNEDSNATGIGGNQGNNGAVGSGAVYLY